MKVSSFVRYFPNVFLNMYGLANSTSFFFLISNTSNELKKVAPNIWKDACDFDW